MQEPKKKPGYMTRAVLAWFVLNFILVATLAAIIYILPNTLMGEWFVAVPLIIGVIVSEWIIMAETIAPIISDWIKQEAFVETK